MLDNITKLRAKTKLPVLVTGDSNLRYYSGVGNLSGLLLIDHEPILITRDMELAQQTPISNIVRAKERVFPELLKMLKKNKIKRVGADVPSMSHELFMKFKSSRIEVVDVSKKLSEIRAVKDEREIGRIKRACELADKAMELIASAIRPGITERELRSAAMPLLSECEDVAFSFIIASGPNSEYTHVAPSERRIAHGEFVIVDLGFKVDGYNSDLTRTFCMGPKKEQKELYNCVLEAHRMAVESVFPGAQCGKIYGKVEKFFKKEDLLGNWKYGLGHGVGLDIHEPPYLSKNSREKLKDNMTFTIEPGLHIPGFGGVRIEDTVLLDKRVKKLTGSEYFFEV